MTIAVCGHDIGPFYTSPTGDDCCQWCEDVRTARTEARAEALKEAAEVARTFKVTIAAPDRDGTAPRSLVRANFEIAEAIEARLK